MVTGSGSDGGEVFPAASTASSATLYTPSVSAGAVYARPGGWAGDEELKTDCCGGVIETGDVVGVGDAGVARREQVGRRGGCTEQAAGFQRLDPVGGGGAAAKRIGSGAASAPAERG